MVFQEQELNMVSFHQKGARLISRTEKVACGCITAKRKKFVCGEVRESPRSGGLC